MKPIIDLPLRDGRLRGLLRVRISQYVARPPEISNTAPVENEQSSEASQAASAASSSTRTKRFFEIFDSMKSMWAWVIRVEDRGLGRGRRHRIDHDVVLGKLLAERLRQRDQAGFRGRVMRGVGIAFLAGDGGDVDDAPVVLLDHQRGNRLAETDERTVEIDAQHLAPLLEVSLPDRLVDAGDAGIVDENVDLAEGFQRFVACFLNGREIRHVDLDGRDALADRLCRLLGQWLIVIPDRDLGAGGDKALGDRAAQNLARRR